MCDPRFRAVKEKNMELAKTLSPTRRPKGLVTEIVKTLADDIRLGRLVEGSKLPTESELSERFDVSRTVVREAKIWK